MGDSAVLRPAPSGSGTLAKTPLLHLLVYVHDRKLSGTIELVTPDKRTTAAIRFLAGDPAKLRTNAVSAHLGDILRELGYLTDRQHSDSIAGLQSAKAAGQKVLHGQLLLDGRVIDRRQLEAGLREQLARKLRSLAMLPAETMYGFYDGYDGLRGWGGDDELGYDLLPMLGGVLAANPPLEHMAAGLAKIGSAELRMVRNPDVDRLLLDEAGRRVVELLRSRPLRVTDLVAESRLDERAVHLATYLLLISKQVEVLRGEGQRSVSIAPSPASARRTWPSDPGASTRPSIPPARPSPSGTPAAKVTTSPPPASLSEEMAGRWRDIQARAQTIDRSDYFMMLDLARDATKEEIQTAFFTLAKTWHPDRLPAELAPVRDACSRVFARMSEAHATLTDDEKRKHYMGLLADGTGSPETQETVAKVIEAATDFQKAEVCFKRNDLVQAERWCTKAMEGDPTQPNYKALLAWLIALKPDSQTPEKTLASIKMLDAALAMNEKAEHAHLWRGLLYKRIGRDDLAMRDFKRTVELNPRNIDAAREVRLHTMRASRSSMPAVSVGDAAPASKDDPGKPGLIGRLFKK